MSSCKYLLRRRSFRDKSELTYSSFAAKPRLLMLDQLSEVSSKLVLEVGKQKKGSKSHSSSISDSTTKENQFLSKVGRTNKLSLACTLSFRAKGKRRTCTFTGILVSLSPSSSTKETGTESILLHLTGKDQIRPIRAIAKSRNCHVSSSLPVKRARAVD